MTRFAKIYETHRYFNVQKCKIPKNNTMNREGYGYIKRRVGLLSSEVGTPTYLAISELSEYISKNIIKASK